MWPGLSPSVDATCIAMWFEQQVEVLSVLSCFSVLFLFVLFCFFGFPLSSKPLLFARSEVSQTAGLEAMNPE